MIYHGIKSVKNKTPNKQIQAKWKTRSQWDWLSDFTLPETNTSPLKIGYSIPSQKEKIIFQPCIFRCKLAVSFREGTFPFTTCWRFCLIIFSPISLSVGGFVPGSTLIMGWVVGFAGVKNLILTTIAEPPYCRREMTTRKITGTVLNWRSLPTIHHVDPGFFLTGWPTPFPPKQCSTCFSHKQLQAFLWDITGTRDKRKAFLDMCHESNFNALAVCTLRALRFPWSICPIWSSPPWPAKSLYFWVCVCVCDLASFFVFWGWGETLFLMKRDKSWSVQSVSCNNLLLWRIDC